MDRKKETVKVRKVGNSLVLTVPNRVAEEMSLYEGQEFSVGCGYNVIEYVPDDPPRKIDWAKYRALGNPGITGVMDTADYIRMLRDEDEREL